MLYNNRPFFITGDADDDDDDEPTIEQCKKYIKACPKGEKGKLMALF